VILAAMRAASLRRIVVVSSFNAIAATVLKDMMADKEVQESEVRSSYTEWTIVQPLGLTDETAMGPPFVSTEGARQATQVARADVASVCLDAIEAHRYVRETVSVSGMK
jgi:hypothetical protein